MSDKVAQVRFWYRPDGEPITKHATRECVAYRGAFTAEERRGGVKLTEWIKRGDVPGGFIPRTVHGQCEPIRVGDAKPGEHILFALLSVDLLTLQVGEVLALPA